MVNTKLRLIIFFAAKDGDTLYRQQKTRPGADYSSDHELLIAKFRLKLTKTGKTTRPFRYDLNQIPDDYTVEVIIRLFRYDLNHIPYDYTVKVTNRFKGLDLIECLKNYGWRLVTLYRRQ